MFRTLYSQLALALFVIFLLILGFLIYATDVMFDQAHTSRVIGQLIAGAVFFALVMGLMVFFLLTYRLRGLADAVDAFVATSFVGPVKILASNPHGDEIDRLGYAFEQMEKRMVEQLQSLQRMDQQRRELLANVSHDLRTPLASMQGYIETLLIKEDTLSPTERRNYLEIAAKHSERLGKLVGNLFDLTKFDANEIKPRLETFSLRELAQDVAQKFRLAAERKNILLEVNAGEDALGVQADIGLIERVLENLIENAIRHCEEKAVIRLMLKPQGQRVNVTVRDTGSGIPQAELQNVFERYYRVQRTEQENSASTGLGLAITKRIVELHGGTIRVESRLDQGTAFVFDLPAA